MRLRTIGLIVTFALGILLAPLAAEAQQAGKVYRIGVLGTVDSPPWQTFRQALGELGYVEGRNVVIEWRWSEGKMERWSTLAADLVSLKPDVIVAAGGPGPRAVKPLTGAIPIVMTNHPDPVGLGLVASLARPGGNVTGLSILTPEIVGKQLELLREVVPGVTRVAVLGNPGAPSHSS